MNVEGIFREVQSELSPKRWRHTQGVMDKAVELAERYGENVDQARLAALLHDITREWDTEKWLAEAELVGLELDEAVRHSPVLLHAPLAAWANWKPDWPRYSPTMRARRVSSSIISRCVLIVPV